MGFSSFRDLMDIWDSHLVEEELDDKVNGMLDASGYVLYFEKDGELYGSGEDGRLAFARIKNPDESMPDGWDDEATFSAQNLTKELSGESSQSVFDKESLPKVKVLDREEIVKRLSEKAKEMGDKAFPEKPKFQVDLAKFFQVGPGDVSNQSLAKEKDD